MKWITGETALCFCVKREYPGKCGQFPERDAGFAPSDVNQFGLLSDLEHANTVAAKLRASFPDDPHCRNCRVWQIARDVEPCT